jgi:hypothetical protein
MSAFFFQIYISAPSSQTPLVCVLPLMFHTNTKPQAKL